MAGPWERYAAPQGSGKPWERFAAASGPGPMPEITREQAQAAIDDGRADGAWRNALLSGAASTAVGAADLFRNTILGPAQRFVPSGRDMVERVAPGALDYRGESRADGYARSIGEMLPGAVAMGAPIGQFALAPGIAAEAAGQATEGRTFPEWMPGIGGRDVEPAARTAAAVAAPSAYGAGVNAARRVATPYPADPARVAAADRLKAEGVDTTAGQRVGSQNLRYREDAAGRTQQIVSTQDEQFTAAALRRLGSDARRATPDVMEEARTRIGGMFDDLAARNQIAVDQPLLDDLVTVKTSYERLSSKNNIAPLIQKALDDVAEAARLGKPLAGDKYQRLRSDLSKATKSPDIGLSSAARDAMAALDNAMQRSLIAAGRPEDIRAYAEARRMWQDYLAIQNAVSRAGEDTALGIINPRQLRGAAAGQSRASYVSGARDIGNLARDGNAVMAPLPQSGTQPRIDARTLTGIQAPATGTAGGLLAYGITGDPTIASAVGAASTIAPAARNAFEASRLGQAYLGNQMFAGPGATLLGGRNLLGLQGELAD